MPLTGAPRGETGHAHRRATRDTCPSGFQEGRDRRTSGTLTCGALRRA